MKRKVNVAELIAPSFDRAFHEILRHNYTHYWFSGGRGSTKSSFVSMMIPLLLMNNKDCHAVVLRKVANTIKTSIFPQIQWAIGQLGVSHLFKAKSSPHEITYLPTGQKILFFGVDDPQKVKSIKLPFGYVGIVWFEELDQFNGMEEIRNLNQSLLRGGSKYWEFCSYNPPKSQDSWVNSESLLDEIDRYIHRSNYLSVPKEWLGEQFFLEAEKLKSKNELSYRHEYLGEVTGTGGAVFENVEDMAMTDEMIDNFDYHYSGLDFGFAVDPLAYVGLAYDRKREIIYIYDEIYQQKLSNHKTATMIKERIGNHLVMADSAEPNTIFELRNLGLTIMGAKKGPDSVSHGIKWLQERAKIYIDKSRCPNTYQEFVRYEYDKTKDGKYISAYPDKNNHAIDATRYALSDIIRNRSVKAGRVNTY